MSYEYSAEYVSTQDFINWIKEANKEMNIPSVKIRGMSFP